MKRYASTLGACLFTCFSLYATEIEIPVDFASHFQHGEWQDGWESEEGLPKVPHLILKVLLPYQESLSTVEFQPEPSRFQQQVRFETAPFAAPLCEKKSRKVKIRNFSVGEQYPDTGYQSWVVEKLGYRIAYVKVFPLKYYPATEEAFFFSKGFVKLTTKPLSSPLYRGFPADKAEILSLVEFDEEIITYPTEEPRIEPSYLVIGPETLLSLGQESGLKKLLDQKKTKGLIPLTLSTEEITELYHGSDLQQKIRNAIAEYYKYSNLKYVLLLGNGYSVTPSRRLSAAGESIPSDLYFGCLDGDFQNGSGDVACEVAVGRFPVTTLPELETMVKKTMEFSKSLPNSRESLFLAEVLRSDTLASTIIETVIKGGVSGSLTNAGFPEGISLNKMYETFNHQYKANDVISALTKGNFSTVNHLGHANETYCMRFQMSQISQMKNSFPFFGITQGCHPGDMSQDNWASQMVRSATGGAVALIANSNYGYFYPGMSSKDGPSNRFHAAFYNAVFKENTLEVGRASQRAKERLASEVKNNSSMRAVVYETNLFGDPDLTLNF